MEFKKTTLSNGLTIIAEVNKSAQSAAAGFFVRTGSRDETAAVSGVSHFLEHMVFKGTEKLSAVEVNEVLLAEALPFRINQCRHLSSPPGLFGQANKLFVLITHGFIESGYCFGALLALCSNCRFHLGY